MGKRRHAASGRLGRGCPRLRLGPQKARAAPPPASSLQLFRRRRAALRQAAAALHHTRCTCRAACRLRVPVEHAADRRLRGRKITGLPARARHDERRAPPWPVRSRAYHLKRWRRLRDGAPAPWQADTNAYKQRFWCHDRPRSEKNGGFGYARGIFHEETMSVYR